MLACSEHYKLQQIQKRQEKTGAKPLITTHCLLCSYSAHLPLLKRNHPFQGSRRLFDFVDSLLLFLIVGRYDLLGSQS
jgi:hypothetical protein